jgi:hypothetical protein
MGYASGVSWRRLGPAAVVAGALGIAACGGAGSPSTYQTGAAPAAQQAMTEYPLLSQAGVTVGLGALPDGLAFDEKHGYGADGELVPPPPAAGAVAAADTGAVADAVVVPDSPPSDVYDILMFADPATTEESTTPRRMVITIEPASTYGAEQVQAALDAGAERADVPSGIAAWQQETPEWLSLEWARDDGLTVFVNGAYVDQAELAAVAASLAIEDAR